MQKDTKEKKLFECKSIFNLEVFQKIFHNFKTTFWIDTIYVIFLFSIFYLILCLILKSSMYEYFNVVKYKEKTTVIKAGYMPKKNLILKEMEFMNKKTINLYDISLSAHSSYDELIFTMLKMKPKNLILVHGQGIEGISMKNTITVR